MRDTKQLCKCNPFITQDSGKSNVPSFPDCFGLQTFSKRLATNRLRWHWKDCSNVLQVLRQNVSHSIIDADRKEGRKLNFSKAILPKIQPKEIGFKGSIQVRRYYVIQNLKGVGGGGGNPPEFAETNTWGLLESFLCCCAPLLVGLFPQPGHLGSMLCCSFSLTLKKWIT